MKQENKMYMDINCHIKRGIPDGESSMMYPRVHLNGTSRKELLEQYEQAYRALDAAYAMLRGAFPHARDYYVISDSAYSVARHEHEARMQALAQVKADMLDIYQAIEQQGRRHDEF